MKNRKGNQCSNIDPTWRPLPAIQNVSLETMELLSTIYNF